MSKPRTVKARCRCGQVLSVTEGPNGFKTVCPSCQSTVRVRVPERQVSALHQRGSVAVTCICGHQFATSPKRVGHDVECPNCGDVFTVPTPGDDWLELYRSKDTQSTDEIPTQPKPQ